MMISFKCQLLPMVIKSFRSYSENQDSEVRLEKGSPYSRVPPPYLQERAKGTYWYHGDFLHLAHPNNESQFCILASNDAELGMSVRKLLKPDVRSESRPTTSTSDKSEVKKPG